MKVVSAPFRRSDRVMVVRQQRLDVGLNLDGDDYGGYDSFMLN